MRNFISLLRNSPLGEGFLGFLIIKASRSHSDTPHSVGIFWTSDRSVGETCTSQLTTLTRDKHPCPGGIRTHSRQAAADPRPRARGYWDRPSLTYRTLFKIYFNITVPSIPRSCKCSFICDFLTHFDYIHHLLTLTTCST